MKFVDKLKHRLSASIDWRVRQEFDRERLVVLDLSRTLVEASSELTEQNRVLTEYVQQLEKRIQLLEAKCK
jgi:hypothetical protein